MPKSGTIDFIKDFMDRLDVSLERLYQSYHKENKVKQEAEWQKTKETIKNGIGTGLAVIGAVAFAVFRSML